MTDTLVLTAHPGDFVWRAGGAIALAAARGGRVVIGCMSFGERGESASLWRKGYSLDQVKAHRRGEAEQAAEVLGAEIRFFDADDYPLVETRELLHGLIDLYREVQPAVVLTHAAADPYNGDHAFAHAIALKSRILAQAPGVEGPGEVIGAPPVFCFEPHQPEQCGFLPNVLLDITEVWDRKREAMQILAAQAHLHGYYTDLGRRRGLQASRNSGPNLGLASEVFAEAYMRIYPQVTRELS
ncbi:PIG-L deacetylase family protein [Actinoplanes rectilineatus]|uniref:PIG-L deacetylase family protein n=1 Tax=Actinoplanes rectilineatus TaxID=113571 RepID=UPI0005F2DC26|nr:PIG-L deacetylase family protein [Actinoplanes rectilineatus]